MQTLHPFPHFLNTTEISMATQDTVDLGPPHAPKEDSIKAFNEIEHDLKRQLIHTRHQHDSKQPSPAQPVAILTRPRA